MSITEQTPVSIVRTEKRATRYTLLDNTALEDKRLSWRAKGLHAYLMSKPDGWQVQVVHLVGEAKEGRDAVYTALNELIELGYAERIEQRSHVDGQFIGNDYVIRETPLTEKPHTGEPYTVNPQLVITETEVIPEVSNIEQPIEQAPTIFEQAWRAYPKRLGGNSKALALKAWRARVRSGCSAFAMLDGTLRYALFCEMTGKVGTEYVMMASTFYGPAKRFADDWDVAAPQEQPRKRSKPDDDDESTYMGAVRA